MTNPFIFYKYITLHHMNIQNKTKWLSKNKFPSILEFMSCENCRHNKLISGVQGPQAKNVLYIFQGLYKKIKECVTETIYVLENLRYLSVYRKKNAEFCFIPDLKQNPQISASRIRWELPQPYILHLQKNLQLTSYYW